MVMSPLVSDKIIEDARYEIRQALFRIERKEGMDVIDKCVAAAFPAFISEGTTVEFTVKINVKSDIDYKIIFSYKKETGCVVFIIPFISGILSSASWYMWEIRFGSPEDKYQVIRQPTPTTVPILTESLSTLEKEFFRFQTNHFNALLGEGACLNDCLNVCFEENKAVVDKVDERINVRDINEAMPNIMLGTLGRVNLAVALTRLLTENSYENSNKTDKLWVAFNNKPIIYFERNSKQRRKFAYVIHNRNVIKQLPDAIKRFLDTN